jgi:ribose transport system ATP-binding protein
MASPRVRCAAELGTACILITRRLDEIMAVCVRVVVMVDGQVVAELPTRTKFANRHAMKALRNLRACFPETAGLTRSALVSLMGAIEAPRERTAEESLRVLSRPLVIDSVGKGASDLPIQASAGEIIGFAGLDGHGQRERLRALFTAARKESRKGRAPSVAYVAGDRVSGDRSLNRQLLR